MTLELGGHSPMIVLADAPMELAVADGVKRSFRNAGQLCNSVNRVFVERAVADEFIGRLTERAAKLIVGHGLADPEPDLGPLTTSEGLARVEAHVADARAGGSGHPHRRGAGQRAATSTGDCSTSQRSSSAART